MSRTYRIVALNCHAGLALRFGIISWLRVFVPFFNVLLACEVRDPERLKKLLGRRWMVFPATDSDTCVCMKKVRRGWVPTAGINRSIRFGSKHVRRLVGLYGRDRKTDRRAVFSVLHPDPLARGFAGADPRARARHILQVRSVVRWHSEEMFAPDLFQCSGGDGNESVERPILSGPLAPKTAPVLFEGADMVDAWKLTTNRSGPRRLMVIYVTEAPWVDVLRCRNFTPRVRGLDHEVAVAWVRVESRG